jgi:predicted MFS family arabinose efflux permease
MASTDERVRGPRGLLLPYAEIFQVPRAWRFSVAGIIGRMPMSMFGLGTVLLISAGTGQYAVAGSVSAVGSLGLAVCAPQIARLADARGQRAVLLPLVTLFALGVLGLIAAVALRAPAWTLFASGTVAGATMPSLGPMARARWSALLAGSPRLHAAFSLESVADELCFVVGPALVTVLATEVHPAAGIAAAALLCLSGTLWFAAQRDTQPPLFTPVAGAQAPAAHPSPERAVATPPVRRRLLAAPGLVVLLPVYLFLGGMFVTIDLSTVVFASDFGLKPIAGLVLACYAAGSGTGGLWYGTRAWRAPAGRRFAVTLIVTVAGVCTFWVTPSLAVLAPVIFCCGLTIAPTLIAGYSLLEAQALPGRTTEAMSWLSTGISVGVAGGSTAAGFVLDALGARWGYGLAAAFGVAAALVCLAGARRLRSLGGQPNSEAYSFASARTSSTYQPAWL